MRERVPDLTMPLGREGGLTEEFPEFVGSSKNIRAALYPRVDPKEPAKVTVGGINLAVSAYSRHPEEAFDAAVCLRSPENQITNAQKGGLPPTIERLYDTPQIKEAYPGFADLLEQSIRNGVPRPVTPAYSEISLAIQRTLHPPREIEPTQTIERLKSGSEERIQKVREGGLF